MFLVSELIQLSIAVQSVSQLYLADRPHVPQVLTVLGEMKVPVDLQDKLQVQVLPVCSVMDEVGIHPLPRLII